MRERQRQYTIERQTGLKEISKIQRYEETEKAYRVFHIPIFWIIEGGGK